MRTAIGLAVVAAILIGLPLLALTAGRRLPVPKPAKVGEDPAWWLSRHLGVAGADHATIVEAVSKGRQVEPRLRPAAVAYARRLEQQLQRKQLPDRPWVIFVWLALSAAAVANLVFIERRWQSAFSVFYILVYPVLLVWSYRARIQRVQRAIELNSEE